MSWICARRSTPTAPCWPSGPGCWVSVPVCAPDPLPNLPQGLLAEVYGVSQATASRVIGVYTPLIAGALSDQAPDVEYLDPTAQLIVDGTLIECWSWKDRPELYSGMHKATGLSVQVACTLSGTLAWVSDPGDRQSWFGGCPYVVCQAAAGRCVDGCGV